MQADATNNRVAATLRNVADQAGVSLSTASRVVRRADAVSDSARLRVRKAIVDLGYYPNLSARTIRTGSSHTIGYIVPDVRNWFYSNVFVGAQAALQPAGYELVLGTSNGDVQHQAAVIDSFTARRFDGLILSLADEISTHLPQSFSSTPMVLIDRELVDAHTHQPMADAVLSDHGAGVRAAVRHLAQLGHRDIAILLGKTDLYAGRSRRDAFYQSADENGLDVQRLQARIGDRSVKAGYQQTVTLMTSGNKPTALICGTNQLLHGALAAIQALRIAIPDDLSLVAGEDSDICRLYQPPITVIRRDVELVGRTAAEHLLSRLRASQEGGTEQSPMRRTLLETEFVLRESTAVERHRVADLV